LSLAEVEIKKTKESLRVLKTNRRKQEEENNNFRCDLHKRLNSFVLFVSLRLDKETKAE
jgi:RNA binding exosome subunit